MQALPIAIMHPYPLVLGALSSLFVSFEKFTVAHICLDYEQLISVIGISKVDFALINIDSPILDENVKSMIRRLLFIRPDIQLVLYADKIHSDAIAFFKSVGVAGLFSKKDMPEELLRACEQLLVAEEFYASENIEIIDSLNSDVAFNLSSKELEVIKLIVSGHTLVEIAEMKQRSLSTISTHKYNAMRKLGIDSNPELLKFAYDNNLFQSAFTRSS